MVAGLVVAGIVASSACAQDAPKKEKGKRFRQPAYAEMMKGQPAGALLTEKIYVDARVKNLPADMPQDRKDSITKRAGDSFKAIAKAAKVEITKDTDGLTEEQYKTGSDEVRKARQAKGKRGGGDSK
jgi:hypothetical protein